jgi:ankyrin repeat protein
MQARTPKVHGTQDQSRQRRITILAWCVVAFCVFGYIGKTLLDRYARSALFDAATHGDNARLLTLLRLGVSPNLVDGDRHERTPLIWAAACANWNTVHLLLNSGAKADLQYAGESALQYAVQQRRPDEVKELLEHHADPNQRTMSPLLTALGDAIGMGDAPVTQMLLDHGADPNGCDALCTAVVYGRLDLVKLLVEHGADVNRHSQVSGAPVFVEGGPTPLMKSVEVGSKEIVQFLLAHGADPNVKWTPFMHSQRAVETPLTAARKAKRQDIVEILRRAGAKE